jgi:signal peptidase
MSAEIAQMTSAADGLAAKRHGLLYAMALACVMVATFGCAALAVAVVTLHLSVRPVLTGSMRPTYGPGAILVTKPVSVTDLHRGMIVVFVPPGEHVEFAHRITSVSGSPSAPVITTKGDANKAPDPWRAQLTTATVSEVIATVPWVGRLMVGLRGPLQLVLVVLGGLCVAVSGTRWILRPRRLVRPSAT